MVKNYDSVVSSFLKYTTCFKQTESTKTTKIKKTEIFFFIGGYSDVLICFYNGTNHFDRSFW